ncbi:Inner membrane protein YqaA [Xanthomonas citri pv. fuscans]|uniref:Inner membrane protein yqaA n=1 Tax=Xanthomonas campestris pv. phaseoli TaxID=317013 RepID=A0A7Z7J1A8_XANCH|nr:Inner membrane protein YqaA [Xanthomonas citri pv. fuscans]SOO24170.1 Inner membrane protein yqaA [Xanthomonas phaseoli pv. phaseoli]
MVNLPWPLTNTRSIKVRLDSYHAAVTDSFPWLPLTYFSLFVVSLIAATLLPAQSEAVLVALLLDGGSAVGLVAIASLGNVLGSLINWWIGREAVRFQGRRWFPIKPNALLRAQAWYRRYGKWSLLLSWMPVIGDPLTLAAGVMREPLRAVVPLLVVAKTTRYAVVAWATLAIA